MKQVVLLGLLLNLGSAHAIEATEADDCEAWKNKASLYMNWRQQGVSLAEAVKDTNGNRSRGLLLRAYNEPQQQGFDAQYTAIQTFSNTVFQECQTAAESPQPRADQQ